MFHRNINFFLKEKIRISYHKCHTPDSSVFVERIQEFRWNVSRTGRLDCEPVIHEPFFFFQLYRDRSDDHATRIRTTYSWSRLIIDIYNGNKFQRDFRLVVVRWGNNHCRENARKESTRGLKKEESE